MIKQTEDFCFLLTSSPFRQIILDLELEQISCHIQVQSNVGMVDAGDLEPCTEYLVMIRWHYFLWSSWWHCCWQWHWCWWNWTLHRIPRHDQVDNNNIFSDAFGDIVAGHTAMMILILFIAYFCCSSCWLEIYFENLFSKIQDGRRRGPLQPNKQNKGQVSHINFVALCPLDDCFFTVTSDC